MAIKFDLGQKTTFDNAMRGSNVDATLDAGNKATSRGIKTTKDALSNAVAFIYGLGSRLGSKYDEVDSSGTHGSLVNSYKDLIHSVDATYTGVYNISTTSEISTQQLMLCAIDVELALVEHLLKISGDTGVSKENQYKARRLAADLAKKIAIDYRNLCIIGNPAGGTPVFEETIPGTSVNVMTSAPTGKNLYQIYKYVHDNYNTGGDIRSKGATTFTGAGLATDHSGSKTLPNDSLARFLGVSARDFGRRINPFGKKKLEPEDRDMFGRLHRSDKAGLIITASAVGLAVAISVTAAVSNFVGKDNESEQTTGVEDTMAPEDTAINNPALDGVVTEAEPETNADGEVVTEPESDTNDYDEPSAERNDDYGYSEDFENPYEKEEITIPDEPEEDEPEVESEEPVKTTETSEEGFDEDEPAGRF